MHFRIVPLISLIFVYFDFIKVKVAALQCLVKIMSLYYQYMESYMGQVIVKEFFFNDCKGINGRINIYLNMYYIYLF